MSHKMAIAEKWVTSNSPTKEAALPLSDHPVNEDENPSISKQQEVAHHQCINSNSPPISDAEEEALSLSDLPIAKDDKKHSTSQQEDANHHKDVEFNFNSFGNSALAESEMCNADEIFFQGQILPFRHSVSSDNGFTIFQPDSQSLISRSQSMDHRYSGAHLSSGSSTRSSSIKSDRNSVTSGSSASTTKTQLLKNHKPPIGRARNQFHSHPSPSPQIRRNSSTPHRRQKSTLWSFFQVSLIRTPEIKLADFKIRNKNNGTNFGSRNSTNSTSSTSANSVHEKRQKKQWNMLFDINGGLFGGGGCKSCSVDQTVNPRINGDIKYVTFASRNRSFGHAKMETFEKNGVEGSNKKNRILLQEEEKKGKQAMSRHRTFEWLKQLSSEGGPED